MNKRINNNFYNKFLKSFARELRSHSTLSEVTIWNNLLRARQLKGYQFLRQRPIDTYIVDFFCKELKLIIELDGLTHEYKQKEDLERQKLLENLGYTVMRFTDAEVIEDFEEVQERIEDWIDGYESKNPAVTKFEDRGKKSSPLPPSKGE